MASVGCWCCGCTFTDNNVHWGSLCFQRKGLKGQGHWASDNKLLQKADFVDNRNHNSLTCSALPLCLWSQFFFASLSSAKELPLRKIIKTTLTVKRTDCIEILFSIQAKTKPESQLTILLAWGTWYCNLPRLNGWTRWPLWPDDWDGNLFPAESHLPSWMGWQH